MDFNFSEDTLMLKNNAERFLKEKCPTSAVKNMLQDEQGFSPALWKEMADLGWMGLIYEEKYGGYGGTFLDLFILCKEMGKTLLPSPFFCSAVLAGLLLKESGDEKAKGTYLPPLIRGEMILTVALLGEGGTYDLQNPGLQALEDSGGYRLSGTCLLVPFAHVAAGILALANVKGGKENGPTLFLTKGKTEGPKITPLNTITGEKTFVAIYEKTKADRIGEAGKGEAIVQKIWPRATVLKCGEMLGGLERVVEMTVEYTKQRQQFGKPIGSLQAIQHYCADLATFLETTRMIVSQAASLLNEGVPCAKEIAMAKAWCSDAYRKSTWIAHQIHGGIGFTEEHDLHLYYKHAKASELEFGDSLFHRGQVAKEMGL